MKNLLNILLISGILFIGLNLNAKDIYLSRQTNKDYSVFVKLNNELKLGNNEFNIKIIHKNKSISNAHVNLKLYKPNGEVVKYSNEIANDDNNYIFNIVLNQKGKYQYVISYNLMVGGVSYYSRGSFEL